MSDYISKSRLKEISEIQKGDFNSVESIRAWIDSQPTLDEKEIIRKAIEEIIARLQELERKEHGAIRFGFTKAIVEIKDMTIPIFKKEECGINE